MVTEAPNAPEESAVTVVTAVAGAAAPGAVPVTATSTVAPGAAVPLTVTEAASTVTDGRVRLAGTFPPSTASGAVTCSAAAPGGGGQVAGRDDGRLFQQPPGRLVADQPEQLGLGPGQRAADPSGRPSVKPIDAVAGSAP